MPPSRICVERAGQRPAGEPEDIFRQEARGLRTVVRLGPGLPAYARECETQARRFDKIGFPYCDVRFKTAAQARKRSCAFGLEECNGAPVA